MASEILGLPVEVAVAFDAFTEEVRAQLLEVRRLMFTIAAETEGVGPLTETLKWGEPAYVTEATGSGSTVRLGQLISPVGMGAVRFNCRTTLVATFRTQFPQTFHYQGNRAIVLDPSTPLLVEPLAICLAMSFTYRSRQRRAGKCCL